MAIARTRRRPIQRRHDPLQRRHDAPSDLPVLPIDDECQNQLKAMTEMGLARATQSASGARTIADLDQSDNIRPIHLNEAINYRMLDRHLWT